MKDVVLSNPLSQIVTCKRCKTKFDSMKKIEKFDGYKGISICPTCGYGVKVVKTKQATGYMRSATGQLVSMTPKNKNRRLPTQVVCKPKLGRKYKKLRK